MGKIFDSVKIYGTGTTTSTTLQTFNGGGTNTFVVKDSGDVDIFGKTKTNLLQVTSGTTVGYILTALDNQGNVGWLPFNDENIKELAPAISIQSTPPSSPIDGDRYLISGGTGVWSGKTNQVTEWLNPNWVYTSGETDNTIFITDTLSTYRFNGSTWSPYRGTAILQNGNRVSNSINIGSNDNNDVNFRSSGTTRMTIKSNGNVGIGTTSPSTNFQVNQSSVGVGLISATGVTTSTWPYTYTGLTLVSGVGTLFSDTIKEGDTIQCTGVTLTVISVLSQTSLYCVPNPSAVFGTYIGQNPQPFTLTSGQRFNVTSKGNIGIGTSTPSSIIDIVHGDRGNYPTMRVRTTSPQLGNRTPFQLTTNNYGGASMILGTTSGGDGGIQVLGTTPSLHVNGTGGGFYSSINLSNNQGTSSWSNYGNPGSGWAGMTFSSYAGFGVRTANSNTRGPGIVIDTNNNTVFNYPLPINSGFEVFGMGSNTHIARFSQSTISLGTVNTSQGNGIYSAYTMVTTSDSYFTRLLNVGEIIVAYSANTWPPMYITVNEIVNDNLIYGTHNPSFNYFLGTGSTYGLQGNPRVSIKNNGNVGIGLDSPDSKLVIKGIDSSSSNFGLKVQNSGGTNTLQVRNDATVVIGNSSEYQGASIYFDRANRKTYFNPNLNNGININDVEINARYTKWGTNSGTVFGLETEYVGLDVFDGFSTFKINKQAYNSHDTYTPFGVAWREGSGATPLLTNIGSFIYNRTINKDDIYDRTLNGIKIDTSLGSWTNTTGTSTNIGLNVTVGNADVNYAAVFNGGNVGIGTSTPTEKLDVYNGYIKTNQGLIVDGGTYFGIRFNSSGFSRIAILNNYKFDGVFTEGFKFHNGSYDFLNYDQSGLNGDKFELANSFIKGKNAGIGDTTKYFGINVTGTPTSMLHVVGSDSSSSNYGLKVQNSGGTDNFIVSNFGSVGVGNTSSTNGLMAAYRGLHIQNNTSSYLSIGNTNTSKSIMFGVEDGNFNYQLVFGGGYLYYGDMWNGSSVYTKYNTSNGDWLFSSKSLGGGANVNVRNTDAKVTIVGYGTDSSGNALVVNNVTTGGTYTESPLLVVRNDGNVGIGTSTPSEKLEVSGKTKTTTLQVTNGATTGYVLTATDTNGNMSWQAPTGGGGGTFTGGTISNPTSFTNGLTANTLTVGTFSVGRKFSSSESFTGSVVKTITHNLNTQDVIIQLWDSSNNLLNGSTIVANNVNSVDITVSTTATYKVVIIG